MASRTSFSEPRTPEACRSMVMEPPDSSSTFSLKKESVWPTVGSALPVPACHRTSDCRHLSWGHSPCRRLRRASLPPSPLLPVFPHTPGKSLPAAVNLPWVIPPVGYIPRLHLEAPFFLQINTIPSSALKTSPMLSHRGRWDVWSVLLSGSSFGGRLLNGHQVQHLDRNPALPGFVMEINGEAGLVTGGFYL